MNVAHASSISPARRRGRSRFSFSAASRLAAAFTIGLAPLVVGAAHPASIVAFVSVCSACLIILRLAGSTTPIRGLGWALTAPLAFVSLPFLQLLPIPTPILEWLDPAAARLVTGTTAQYKAFRWFSLDAPSTLLVLAKATACLAVFIISAQAAFGSRRSRNLFVKTVAISGMLALLVAIGHRIWGVSLIYGRFGSARPLLNGPFVNPNHNAEFLELAAFAGLASAIAAGPTFRKILWAAGAVSCAAGALATLSRGSILALAAGGASIALAYVFRRSDSPGTHREGAFSRNHVIWLVAAIAALSLTALSLGAAAVLDRLTKGNVMGDLRLALWRDSLGVLKAHPLGIGGGAFDRVYPVYRTLVTGHATRFSHVENQPLQLLIEYGWPGFAILVLACFATLRALAFRSMALPSLAICAGLVAVLVHNLVDFGLDLLGVSLPFSALVGTLAGQAQRGEPSGKVGPRGAVRAQLLLPVAITAIAIPIMLSSPLRDFDALIRQAKTPNERADLALVAAKAHPADYFYPLVQALGSSLIADSQGHFARLKALNRALELCPQCPDVHIEVARSLWRLGHRKQAIIEYRHTALVQPDLVPAIFDEIWRGGRSAMDLKAFAGPNVPLLLDVCSYLLDRGEVFSGLSVLSDAETFGATGGPVALLRGRAFLLQSDSSSAERFLTQARKSLPTDPKIASYLAESMERNGKTDEAIGVLDAQLSRAPGDLDSARLRLSLLTQHKRWSQTEKALDAFKEALQNAQVSTVEAHVAGARIYLEQGRMTDALSEFRIASIQWPENVELLFEYAQVADRAGQTNQALDLLASVAAIAPGHTEAEALRQKIAARRRQATQRPYLGTDLPAGFQK